MAQCSPPPVPPAAPAAPAAPALPAAPAAPARVLLWSVDEAARRGRRQIGRSACGATALLDALCVLGLPAPSPAEADAAVGTSLRRPRGEAAGTGAGLADYLLSRSCAGATHTALINGCRKLQSATAAARFCSYADILASGQGFLEWCHQEMVGGGALILCMNLQQEGDAASAEWIPDAWHHQMVPNSQ
jgi:hypothetical protein